MAPCYGQISNCQVLEAALRNEKMAALPKRQNEFSHISHDFSAPLALQAHCRCFIILSLQYQPSLACSGYLIIFVHPASPTRATKLVQLIQKKCRPSKLPIPSGGEGLVYRLLWCYGSNNRAQLGCLGPTQTTEIGVLNIWMQKELQVSMLFRRTFLF